MTTPSSRSRASASRTTVRDTAKRPASSISVGSLAFSGNSPLTITAYGQIHETAFRPWQSDNIPRRYCTGDVMLSDGKVRHVHYSIIEDGGFAGFGQGVEWCVTGLDRNWAFNPGCKAARP